MARLDLSQVGIREAPPLPRGGARPRVSTPLTSQINVPPPGRKLERSWLLEYAAYTADTESPEDFHFWTALGTIAGAVQRKVYMQTKTFNVMSNLYVVLVAPPGIGRKTTALRIGQHMLKEVPNINFTTQASSPAALIQQFAAIPIKEHQSLTAYAYELGTFLSTNTAEMVDLVTDLFDGNPDWDKQTVSRGKEKIPRPWFNLLGATTPRWIGDYMPTTMAEGGFASRTIFVYGDKRKLSNPFPRESDEDKDRRKLLVNDLVHISTLGGEASFGPGAEDFYSDWYRDPKLNHLGNDERMTGYFARKPLHVLKVAMLLGIAARDDLLVTTQDLQTSLALLEQIEPGMYRSFSAVGKNIFATDLERILAQISDRGGMTYGQIVKSNYHALEKRRIDELLQQLASMGAIKQVGPMFNAV